MYWIYDIPTWGLAVVSIAFFLLVSTAGLIFSRPWIYRKFHISNDTNEPVNGLFAGVGVLYGILLGLVAVAAWGNYDNADNTAGKEAAAIASLYRDVSTLEEPTKSTLQQDLKNYLGYVITVAWPAHKKGETPIGGTLILSKFLGTLSSYHANSQEQQVFLAEVFTAYNKLIEARRMRLAAVGSGIPAVFWVVILAGALLSIVLCYFFHLSSPKAHLVLTGIYSVFLGFMIFLVAAVDKPFRGDVSISPDAYIAILNGLSDLEAIKGDQ